MFLSLVIAIWAALDTTATIGSFILATLAIPIIAKSLTSKISITENELRIDRAHIERKYLGKVTVLDSDAMRLLRTRDANPAAYLAIRFWASKGVKIELIDPRDPTPYWLITSKRGDELAASLINN
ncbi:unannotated protein [freshwater metagenome]|uniref:Unannotated protein n=1 Tax=freshwater metagenome TaxID=449393 RepID=A0A6J6B6U2_9ZZZZ